MRLMLPMLYASVACLALVAPPALAVVEPSKALSEKHHFDIPAQGLNAALLSLSRQSSMRILFPYEEASRYEVRPVRGWLSTSEALSRMIEGTPLQLAYARDRTFTIAARSKAGLRPAGFTSDAVAAPAPAPSAAEPAPQEDAPTDVIVTGTRQTNRTVAQSLAPIDVVSKADLQTSGKQSVRDLLGTLVPSISVSSSGSGASFAVKTLSLRGLSGDQVLVLVNGKRRHTTATLFINGTTQNGQSPPDLDLIPANAIDHIEVLRDGASAQYGSDAIAGVVNIILKKDASGSATVIGGANGDGGGETGRFQIDKGITTQGGHIHVSVDGYMQGRTVRGGPNLSQLYFAGDPREATADRRVNKPGQPQVVGVNGSIDVAQTLGTSDIEAYVFGTGSKREADAFLTFRNPNATNNIPQIYPNGYIPHLHVHDEDYQVSGGLRGEGPLGVHFDLSTSYGYNKVRYVETTALNASLGPASPSTFYIGKVIGTEWTSNLDLTKHVELGLVEPLQIAVGAEYREDTYEIGAGDVPSYVDGGYRTPAGQPNAGVIRQAGSQGVTGFPPSAAGTFGRNNKSIYLDLSQKVTRWLEVSASGRHEAYSDFGTTNNYKVSARIEPIRGIAVRGTISTGFRAPTLQQEHYASSSTIGVLLPGATTTVLAPVRALPVDDTVARALGSQPLRPEKSTNYSAGLVLTPINNLNVTVDAYQIEIDNRILLSGTLTGAIAASGTLNPVATILNAAGLNPVQSGFFFSNAASTRTRGLDLVATYRAGLGDFGKAVLTVSGNINKTKFTRLDVPAVLAAQGISLIDRARQGDFTRGTPRNKEIVNLYWTLGAVSANVRATRYGEVTQVAAARAADGIYHDDTVAPKVLFDLELGYQLTTGIKLSAGANNLFNIYPNKLSAVNQGNTGFALYNSYSPYGFSGGFYYGKINLSF